MSYCASLRYTVARLIPSSSAASRMEIPGWVSTRTISSRSNVSIRDSRWVLPESTSAGRWRTSITSVRVAACLMTCSSCATFPGQPQPRSAVSADRVSPSSRPRALRAACRARGTTSSGRSRRGGTATTVSTSEVSGAGTAA